MNNFLLDDAISCIDEELIEKHLKKRYALRNKKAKKKAPIWMKWSVAVAACLAVMIIAIPVINNMIGYNSGLSEDEIYDRTHTEYQTYNDLVAIIGNDTLLKNIDFSTCDTYKLILKHELDNVNNYSSLTFEETMPDDIFGVAVYFPPYQDKLTDYCTDENTVVINGITIEYSDFTSGTDNAYFYMAEFEHDGYMYVIRSCGDTDVSVFWEKLSDMLE